MSPLLLLLLAFCQFLSVHGAFMSVHGAFSSVLGGVSIHVCPAPTPPKGGCLRTATTSAPTSLPPSADLYFHLSWLS